MLGEILRDIRFALRSWRRAPLISVIAIASLALGIGANTAIFTWTRAVLLRPLSGVEAPAELMVILGQLESGRYISVSHPDARLMQEELGTVFDGVIAHTIFSYTVQAQSGSPRQLWGALVSGNFFDVLGAEVALGRPLRPDDDRPGAEANVVVVSHGYWQQELGSDPTVVGSRLQINGQPFTVVGVAAEGFHGATVGLALSFFTPIYSQPLIMGGGADYLETRGTQWLEVDARPRPGVTLATAQAALDRWKEGVEEAFPGAYEEMRPVALSLLDHPFGGVPVLKPIVLVLTAVVGLLLLITCANVANLLLARATGRRKELALRRTLGASRGRLLQLLLTESLVLAICAGALGVGGAFLGDDLMAIMLPPTSLPAHLELQVEGPVLLFTLAITLGTGLLFGIAPALMGSRADLLGAVRDEAVAVAGNLRRNRLQRSLVAAQVALSTVLLIASGLLLRSLDAARRVDPGFQAEDVLLASLDLSSLQLESDEASRLLDRLREEVASLPAVANASFGAYLPLGFTGQSSASVRVEGYEPTPGEDMSLFYNSVDGSYFDTLSIPFLAGETFREPAPGDEVREIVINQAMAERFWKGDAVGQRLWRGKTEMRVAGVVPTGKYRQLGEPVTPYVYYPRSFFHRSNTTLHVRGRGVAPVDLAPAVRDAVHSVSPQLAVFDVMPMRRHLQTATFTQNMGASMLGAFGLLALFLSSIGLYGVTAFSIGQRRQELGIRGALGASRGDLVRQFLRGGMIVVVIGLGLGLGGAFAAAGLLRSMLIGVSARDPIVFALVALNLALVAALAILVPVLRATRRPLIDALRHQ